MSSSAPSATLLKALGVDRRHAATAQSGAAACGLERAAAGASRLRGAPARAHRPSGLRTCWRSGWARPSPWWSRRVTPPASVPTPAHAWHRHAARARRAAATPPASRQRRLARRRGCQRQRRGHRGSRCRRRPRPQAINVAAEAAASQYYLVQTDDTVQTIAARTGVTVNKLMALNSMPDQDYHLWWSAAAPGGRGSRAGDGHDRPRRSTAPRPPCRRARRRSRPLPLPTSRPAAPSRCRRAGAGRGTAAGARHDRAGHGRSGRLFGCRRRQDPRGRRRDARPLCRLARHFGGAAARAQSAARAQARGHGAHAQAGVRSRDARAVRADADATTTSGCRRPILPRTASPAPRSTWRGAATRSGASRSATCKVPIWLLQQYNPELDFSDLKPGTQISLPKVEDVTGL